MLGIDINTCYHGYLLMLGIDINKCDMVTFLIQ